jgi:hypothetical protein
VACRPVQAGKGVGSTRRRRGHRARLRCFHRLLLLRWPPGSDNGAHLGRLAWPKAELTKVMCRAVGRGRISRRRGKQEGRFRMEAGAGCCDHRALYGSALAFLSLLVTGADGTYVPLLLSSVPLAPAASSPNSLLHRFYGRGLRRWRRPPSGCGKRLRASQVIVLLH